MLDDDASFCAECGDTVTKSVPTNGITPPPEPMAQNIYAPPNYPAQPMNTAQSSNALNKKKGKKKLIIALAILIPIVLICGVIAGLLIYKHLNTNTVGNTPGNLANGGLVAQQGRLDLLWSCRK
jgi:hypothetical protein